MNFELKDYPRLFKFKIYDSYKPSTLTEMRNYLDYLTRDNMAKPLSHSGSGEKIGVINQGDISAEMQGYL